MHHAMGTTAVLIAALVPFNLSAQFSGEPEAGQSPIPGDVFLLDGSEWVGPVRTTTRVSAYRGIDDFTQAMTAASSDDTKL